MGAGHGDSRWIRRWGLTLTVMAMTGLGSAQAASAAGWALQPVPLSSQDAGRLRAVSCTSATRCVAVGDTGESSVGYSAWAANWNGTTWSSDVVPSPPAEFGVLNGVSCGSPSVCIAVGSYVGLSSGALAERWNGSSWHRIANPAGNPLAIACTSATFCIAVGNVPPLAQSWNGVSWRTMSVPLPAGAQGSSLNGVSCVSAASCTAVGSSQNSAGDFRPLAEHFNGAAWRLQSAVAQGGVRDSYLSGVSCATADACMAVGYATDRMTFDRTFAESWIRGSGWRRTPTPRPGGNVSQLAGVSCTSAGSCIAVGTLGDGTLGESWNGTSWALQATANPADHNPNNLGTGLNGVSCLSGTVCTAVGQDAGFVDGWNPLAERYSGPAAPAPPVGMAAPVIQGQPAVGNYLRCAEGVWDGVPPVKFAYQWIDGGGRTVSSAPVYKVGSKEAGNTLTCQVTARDVAGSTVVASAPVTVS